jgi:hypothetical protein
VVTLELDGGRRVVVTDVAGQYAFTGVEPGRGSVRAELEGFHPATVLLRLRRGGAARADLALSLGTVEEITVTSEAPVVDAFSVEDDLDALRSRQAEGELAGFARDLAQGTVGGVRPLEVEIPERGKLLVLSGALPPQQVRVTLEARRRR